MILSGRIANHVQIDRRIRLHAHCKVEGIRSSGLSIGMLRAGARQRPPSIGTSTKACQEDSVKKIGARASPDSHPAVAASQQSVMRFVVTLPLGDVKDARTFGENIYDDQFASPEGSASESS